MQTDTVRHCSKGHLLIPGNLRGGKKLAAGRLECLTCHRERELARGRARGVQERSNWIERGECANGHPATPDNIRDHKGRPACKTCHREKQIARYHADPDTHRRKASEYQKRNRKERTRKQAEWRAQNAEHVRAYFRWQQRMRRGGKSVEAAEYASLIERDPCSYCGAPATQIDHIEPVTRGGSNEWYNLTAACKACNSGKRDKPLLIWLAKRAA